MRKSFTFYEAIQNKSKGSIMVHGRLFEARIEEREGQDCWLISYKAAIYPNKIEDYLLN